MVDTRELARDLSTLEERLTACMKCGLCQAVCPVYGATGREADVARGKLSLLQDLSAALLEDPLAAAGKIERCLVCGTCEANCPSGVKTTEIFMLARSIITRFRGMNLAQRAIFRGMLRRPVLMDHLMSLGAKLQGLALKPTSADNQTSRGRVALPVIGDHHVKGLAPRPFHADVPELSTPAGTSGRRVAFFVGCAIDKLYPAVGHAVLKTLAHHGVGVYLPPHQPCCGVPALTSGDVDTARSVMRQALTVLEAESYDHIVTACGTCSGALMEQWRHLAEDEAEAVRVASIADKVRDIAAYLVDELGVEATPKGAGNGRRRVTYHDPCHLRNGQQVTAQPRQLLDACDDLERVEMNEADRCCGCGGSFMLKHGEVSRGIGDRKRANILDSGAEIAATGCPACMMQLAARHSEHGDAVTVRHTIELYAESLD